MVPQQAAPATKYRGVSYDKRTDRWYAYIGVKGTRRHLGTFTDPVEAARAYDAAAKAVRAQPEKLNFPETPNKLVESMTVPDQPDRSYSFHVGGQDVPAFDALLTAAMNGNNLTTKSETLRTAATLGIQTLLNPTPATEAEADEATLPKPTIRNLAMLGSLMVAIQRMPQVAGALTPTVDAIIDAIGRDVDVISTYLDA